ncbi:MAG: hypothetical protein Q7J10_06550 [Methanosarcinaceae archaeon]|nr:hypothetical protein [Methanosarcinaceae archaeon]
MKPTFEEIWGRIREHSGEIFKQIRGGEFTYEFRGGTLFLVGQNIISLRVILKKPVI